MNDKHENIDPKSFEFLQIDEKIYDKKFETKPIGYFKDALIRFGKNRTNVVATTILFTIIFLTIIIPLISNKNYTKIEEQLAYLPPRVPVLEKFGIMDGTSKKVDQPVDLNSIDPETGLGLPIGYSKDVIVMDSLENYTAGCSDKEELCTGGESVLRLDTGSDHVSILSTEFFIFNPSNKPVLNINVHDISSSSNTKLNVYIKPSFNGEYELLESITSIGKHDIKPFEILDNTSTITSKVKLELVSDNDKSTVALKSVELYDKTSSDAIINDTGYSLSKYQIDSKSGAGMYARQNGELLLASFRYRNYLDAFGEKTEIAFGAVEYEEILESYGDLCTKLPDPNNPNGWLFSEGCPIVKVIKQNESVKVGDNEYYSYQVVIDYAKYSGYDEMPYFYFGTTSAGRDLFTLIWVATRTSLLVGLIASLINISIGIIYGAISGYYGGFVDIIMQRISEVISRIPWIAVLSIAIAFLGPGVHALLIVLVVSGWIGVAYVTRTQFYRYKRREYVLASRTLGAKDSRLIFRHILPNGIGTIITSSILMIPTAIFAESTISYLGFGIGHGQTINILGLKLSGVSIGVLLSDGRTTLLTKPHLTIFPALIISILMITFNMFGNALRDAFNPALRGSE